MAACASANRASGSPSRSTAWAAAIASPSAWGSALPMSSDARMINRRVMNSGASPACSIFASQKRAASGSEPRTLLMNAEIVS